MRRGNAPARPRAAALVLSLALACGFWLAVAAPSHAGPAPHEPWQRIVENLELEGKGLRLTGREWDHVLIRNVTIRNAPDTAIYLRDVENVRIENCVILGAGAWGILLSSRGSTRDVTIVGNQIRDTGKDGIHAAQRVHEGVDHPGLRIVGNTIENTGLDLTHGLHGIYVQSKDFLIEGNRVLDTNAGNGISVRSSGVVRENRVIDVVREESDGGYGIAYYSDHAAGPSGTLEIVGNVIDGTTIPGPNGTSIKLLGPAWLEPLGAEGRVRRFIIADNVNVSQVEGDLGITIDPEWHKSGYHLVVSGNRRFAELPP